MQVRASVISTNNDIAYIRVFRENACSGCSGCSSEGKCHTELLFSNTAKTYDCYAYNPISAKPGDTVVVESENNMPLLLAFFTFVLPVIATIVSYIISVRYLTGYYPVIVSCIIFIFSFIICAIISNLFSKKHTKNTICKII